VAQVPSVFRRISLLELVRFHAFLGEQHPTAAAALSPPRGSDRPPTELIDTLVDEQLVFDAIAAAMRATRAIDLPLRFATTTRLEHLGVLGFAIQTAPTLLEALERVERFQSLTSNSGFSAVTHERDEVRIAWQRHTTRLDLGVRVANEIVIAQQLVLARQLGLRGPRRVTFRHRAPADVEAHLRFFGCPVTWGAAHDAALWPHEWLARPLPLADVGLNRFIGEQAAQRLRERSSDEGGLEAIRREIERRLPSADVSIDQVAPALGRSPRALQRALGAEGTTFRRLVDEVRRHRAEVLLQAGTLSLSEVALLLGFSELSAFSRAHRRWFREPARARRVKSAARPVKSRR
jgi:AraC-like DNA-binding protein